MNQETESKYPYSANLFRFCRRVLDKKHGGVRVIDQDVGQILGFDPADCSHWKRGRKNVRSVQAVKSIAQHLGVDERLVVDIATGEINDNEAFFEYSGYGSYQIDPSLQETARKDFYRQHATQWDENQERSFREIFSPRHAFIQETVQEIHTRIQFEEAPLYIPEIVASYKDIRIQSGDASVDQSVSSQFDGTTLDITVRKGAEVRPFTRYKVASAMAQYFLPQQITERKELKSFADHLYEVESNIFASELLAPKALIRQEVQNADPSKDIITQLAEFFWVSRGFMARRVQEILAK